MKCHNEICDREYGHNGSCAQIVPEISQLDRIEQKLDRLLTNELATNSELLIAASSGGAKGFDEILKSWGVMGIDLASGPDRSTHP